MKGDLAADLGYQMIETLSYVHVFFPHPDAALADEYVVDVHQHLALERYAQQPFAQVRQRVEEQQSVQPELEPGAEQHPGYAVVRAAVLHDRGQWNVFVVRRGAERVVASPGDRFVRRVVRGEHGPVVTRQRSLVHATSPGHSQHRRRRI